MNEKIKNLELRISQLNDDIDATLNELAEECRVYIRNLEIKKGDRIAIYSDNELYTDDLIFNRVGIRYDAARLVCYSKRQNGLPDLRTSQEFSLTGRYPYRVEKV